MLDLIVFFCIISIMLFMDAQLEIAEVSKIVKTMAAKKRGSWQ